MLKAFPTSPKLFVSYYFIFNIKITSLIRPFWGSLISGLNSRIFHYLLNWKTDCCKEVAVVERWTLTKVQLEIYMITIIHLFCFQTGKRQRNKLIDENDIPLTMIDTIYQGKRIKNVHFFIICLLENMVFLNILNSCRNHMIIWRAKKPSTYVFLEF